MALSSNPLGAFHNSYENPPTQAGKLAAAVFLFWHINPTASFFLGIDFYNTLETTYIYPLFQYMVFLAFLYVLFNLINCILILFLGKSPDNYSLSFRNI